MLVWLADYLSQFNNNFEVLQYLTLRGILGVLTALAISLIVGPWMIRKLNQLQIGLDSLKFIGDKQTTYCI